jgi:hypothetical protein
MGRWLLHVQRCADADYLTALDRALSDLAPQTFRLALAHWQKSQGIAR